jgi:hypothetical protein
MRFQVKSRYARNNGRGKTALYIAFTLMVGCPLGPITIDPTISDCGL